MKRFISILIFFVGLCSSLAAQNSIQLSPTEDKLVEIRSLIDGGFAMEGIRRLKLVLGEDSTYYQAHYLEAVAYLKMENTEKAIDLLNKLKTKPFDQVDTYYLLINLYLKQEKKELALDYINEGLEKYPHAGALYTVKGYLFGEADFSDKALTLFEDGIRAEPNYADNYYYASRVLLEMTEEKLWGLLYGELFMNLEQNNDRTRYISYLMYDTFVKGVEIESDSIVLKLRKPQDMDMVTKGNSIDLNQMLDDFINTFDMSVYQPLLVEAMVGVKELSLSSLVEVRVRMVELYKKQGLDKADPNVLFNRLVALYDKELLVPYYYNLYSGGKGASEEYRKWVNAHPEKNSKYVDWVRDNPLKIDSDHVFVR